MDGSIAARPRPASPPPLPTPAGDAAFYARRDPDGVMALHAMVEGIQAVGALIARHFPTVDRDELPNRPVLL